MASKEIILTSSSDSPITAYDPLSGTTLARFSGSRSPRRGLALAGNSLIAASHISPNTASNGFIHLYNWWSPAAFHTIHVPEPVAPLTANADGSYLFAGGLSGRIHVFSLPSGELCHSFTAHRQPISCLTINEDESLLISGGDDGMIAIFPVLQLLDVEQRSAKLALYRLDAHSSAVTCIALVPSGCNSYIVSSSLDATCKVWSIADGTRIQTIRFPCPIWCVTVGATDSITYAGGADGQVYTISINRKKRGVDVEAWQAEQKGAVVAMVMMNGKKNLVSASEEGFIRIWEVERGSIVRVLRQQKCGTVNDLLVAAGCVNGQIRYIDDRCNRITGNGFCEREIYRKTRDAKEMEDWLCEAANDRRRAIDMLEVTIETYERLLGLLLKEAKGG